MIRKIRKEDISECVSVIRVSFKTVADELGFTPENAPGFTAFSVNEERLSSQFSEEQRPMYGYFIDGKLVGFYSLQRTENAGCELNNLSVLPEFRHGGIGAELLEHALAVAAGSGYRKLDIGIVEENRVLRAWYEKHGFVHTKAVKFDFFPFTCGYMEKELK